MKKIIITTLVLMFAMTLSAGAQNARPDTRTNAVRNGVEVRGNMAPEKGDVLVPAVGDKEGMEMRGKDVAPGNAGVPAVDLRGKEGMEMRERNEVENREREVNRDTQGVLEKGLERVQEEVRTRVDDLSMGVRTDSGMIPLEARKEAVMQAKQIREDAAVRVEAFQEDAKELIRVKREEFKARVEVDREEFKTKMEEVRTQVQERVTEQKAELREEVQKIPDEAKREAVLRVADAVNALNQRVLEKASDALQKLEEVTANILTRADKAELGGQDVSGVRNAVAVAEREIAGAREAIRVQASEAYSLEISSEDTLRSDVAVVRNELKTDLESVRSVVNAARDAVRSSAQVLAEIPDVNAYRFSEDSESSEKSTEEQ